MLLPECPPRPPLTVTASAVAPPPTGDRGRSMWIQVSVLPAQPTVSRPSSSLSRLSSTDPVSIDPSRAFAPSRPTSSATVISSSSGPCGRAGSSASAIMAAIATPSSAPSVVPSAFSHSPSRTSSMRPCAGSLGLSGRRSQTMSRWPCRITVGAPSRPGVAGTRTTTFPAASCSTGKLRPAAQARTCSTIAASPPEGRGMRVISSKCAQNALGSTPATGDDIATIVLHSSRRTPFAPPG